MATINVDEVVCRCRHGKKTMRYCIRCGEDVCSVACFKSHDCLYCAVCHKHKTVCACAKGKVRPSTNRKPADSLRMV